MNKLGAHNTRLRRNPNSNFGFVYLVAFCKVIPGTP